MNKNIVGTITSVAKLSGVFLWNLVKTQFIGAFFTVLFIIAGLFILAQHIDAGKSGHVSIIPFLALSVTTKPFTAIPYYLLMILSPYFLNVFAARYATSKTINRLVQDEAEDMLTPIIENAVNKITKKKDVELKSDKHFASTRNDILQALKTANENRVAKRIIKYALNKVHLTDIDLSDENLSASTTIRNGILSKLKDITAPSYKTLWIIVAIQWAVLLLMNFTKL